MRSLVREVQLETLLYLLDCRTMEDIVVSIKNKQDRPGHERVFKFLKDPDMITSMRKELDDAIILFAVRLNT